MSQILGGGGGGSGTVTSVTGGTNITTTGTATDPVVNLDASITLTSVLATTFDTNVAASGVTLSGTSLIADGTDANIDINITSKGTGQVIIDDLQLTADLEVQYGGTGVSTLTDHSVLIGSGTSAVTPLAVGSTGETIMGSTGADPAWTGSPSFSGTVTAATGLTVTANDVAISSGSLTLPATTATDGQIIVNSDRMIHFYGNATDYNIFIGKTCGNTTLTTGTAKYNNGIGINVFSALTTGNMNLAFGGSALNLLTEGTYNCAFSNNSLDLLLTGNYNYAFGWAAGHAYTSSESSNICIGNQGVIGESNVMRLGTQGTGNGQQDTTYIAGIYDTEPTGGNDNVVVIDSNGQLGGTVMTAGTGISIAVGTKTTTFSSTGTTVKTEIGTTDTWELSDAGKYILYSNASAISVTVPTNASVSFPVGTYIAFAQSLAGQITFSGTPTLRSADSALTTVKQFSVGYAVKVATDEWYLGGDLEV